MTKAELIKELDKYDDNTVIRFTLDCDNSYRSIHSVSQRGNAGIILKCNDIPDSDDLHSMVDACLENDNNFTEEEEKILWEFANL